MAYNRLELDISGASNSLGCRVFAGKVFAIIHLAGAFYLNVSLSTLLLREYYENAFVQAGVFVGFGGR